MAAAKSFVQLGKVRYDGLRKECSLREPMALIGQRAFIAVSPQRLGVLEGRQKEIIENPAELQLRGGRDKDHASPVHAANEVTC